MHHGSMKKVGYLKAIYDYKYLILALVLVSVTGTAIFGYRTIAPYEVSALVKPGLYIGDTGSLSPVVSAEVLDQVVSQGVLNATIEKSLGFSIKHPFEIKAVLPKGANVIKVSFETKEPAQGEAVISALLTQLSNYCTKEKAEKYDAVSYKYLQGLKGQLPVLELNILKAANVKNRMKYDEGKLLTARRQINQDKEGIEKRIDALKKNSVSLRPMAGGPLGATEGDVRGAAGVGTGAAAGDLLKLQVELNNKQIELKEKDLAIGDKRIELVEKEKELTKFDREIVSVRKQIVTADTAVSDGKSLEVVQAPIVIATGLIERMVKYVFTSLVISLVAGILLAFVLYDVKNNKA